MIPILYESTEKAFTSNGIGRLSDAISCKVKEERNGIYELEMVYPVTGIHYSELNEDRLILAKPNDTSQNQIFRIYSIEKPFNGRVKVLAEHISYILNAMVVKPFSASSCTEAIAKLPQNFVTGSSDFTFDTDKQVTGNFVVEEPISARAVLGGSSGSLLDVYGKADYEFDNFTVHMWQNRGSDNGVTIRYGKNLTDLTSTTDDQEAYAGVVPFWRGTPEDSEEEVLVTLPGYIVWSSHQWDFAYPRIAVYDASSDFDDEPSADALRQRAHSYLTNNESWNKKKELEVDFVSLWQTEEYKDVAAAERVSLCDSVTVTYPKLGVSEKLKVTKTDYNVLLERYNSITLGEGKTNLVTEVASVDQKFRNFQVTTKTSMQLAIEHATNLITGGAGGHVVIGTDADGKPNEIFIMDTDDTATATQILRLNMNGIGFANNINGPYYSAWTLDGHFNADFIYSGTINANLIKAGVIQSDINPGTYWNLQSGEFHLSTGDAQQIAQYVDASGVLLAAPYTLNGNIVNFRAELRVGDDITTLNHPPGAFQWFKKEDYKITYLNAGYTFQFDLADFVYGGSIILRYDKTFDYGLLLDSAGEYLLEDGGDRLVIVDGDQNADYLYAETDFTNGTRTAALEYTVDGLVSRVDHFNGTNQTFETVIQQNATNITTQATRITNLSGDLGDLETDLNSLETDLYGAASNTKSIRSISQSLIDVSATSIRSEVAQTYLTKTDASNTYTTLAVVKSQIAQTANTISLSVTNNTSNKTASITLQLTDPSTGSAISKTTTNTINLNGYVTFTNLGSDDTSTHIDGGHIFGGTLSLGGKSNTKGNGQLKIYNSNDVEIGSWDTNGLIVTNSASTLRTSLLDGQWHVWRNNSGWKEIGNAGYFELTVKDHSDRFTVFGINAIKANAAGMALCIDGVPYYAMNTSSEKSGGFDVGGQGYRHYFKESIMCDGVYKTWCGYGWTGNWSDYWWTEDQPEVGTGGNVALWNGDGYGNLTVEGVIHYYNMTNHSDRRDKHDIVELDLNESKQFIMGLNPVQYRYDSNNPEILHHGFIAQDVIKVSDWSVSGSERGRYSINMIDYIADLVKVVQDQEKRIKELEVVNERIGR